MGDYMGNTAGVIVAMIRMFWNNGFLSQLIRANWPKLLKSIRGVGFRV